MRPHKYVCACGPEGDYQWAIYCEYCGLVVFHANNSRGHKSALEESLKGCPLAPETKNVTVLSR